MFDPPLTLPEQRVLGCLIEKGLATPDYYPLTLNALVNACNQSTSRDPVMSLDEAAVMSALPVLIPLVIMLMRKLRMSEGQL